DRAIAAIERRERLLAVEAPARLRRRELRCVVDDDGDRRAAPAREDRAQLDVLVVLRLRIRGAPQAQRIAGACPEILQLLRLRRREPHAHAPAGRKLHLVDGERARRRAALHALEERTPFALRLRARDRRRALLLP